MKRFGQIDETAVQRGLLTFFLIIGTVFLAWFGLSRNLPVLGLLIPAIAILCGLFSRPALIFILVQLVSASLLTAPRLPTSFPLSRFFLVVLIGWALLDAAFRRQNRPFSYRPAIDRWMLVFALNLLLITAVRGVGFSFTGGAVYGGMAYIGIWLSIAYYFSLVRIRFSESDLKKLLFAVPLAACIPVAVEILLYVRTDAALWLTKYIAISAEYVTAEEDLEGGITRWSSFSAMGSGFITVAFVFCKKIKYKVVLIGLAIFLIALSGFRSRFGSLVVLVVWLSLYFSKKRMKTALLLGLIGLFAFVFLMVAAPMLPSGAKRAVSFLPGISVGQDVITSGADSTNWRINMWRDYCVPVVPKYLLIGKGLSRDITAYAWLNEKWYGTAEFFYFMGAYHSGPFNLLINYGLIGTVSFTLFFLLTIIDGWKTVRRYASRQDTLVSRYYGFLTVQLTWSFIAFYLIFGDVSQGLLPMLANAAQMRILKKFFLMETADVDVEAVQNVERLTGRPPSSKSANRWALTTAEDETPEHRSR